MFSPDGATLLEHFRERRDALLSELESLVRFDSPTRHVPGIERLAAHCAGELERAGFATRLIPDANGPHLLAERAGREPALVLVGHTDTVWPRGEPERRPPRVADGKLFGPGVYDMRAGLALILWAARAIAELDCPIDRRLMVFLSADEEAGSITARPRIEELLPRDAVAFVPEPPCPDGALKVWRKGVGIFELKVEGREAHAGVDPERGASAIAELCRHVLAIDSFRDPARGILVNIGTISGGTATNVVSGEARAGIDLRFDRTEDGEELERRLRALVPYRSGVRLEVAGELVFPPLVPTRATLELIDQLRAIARDELGLEISSGSSGGGSDGSYLASRGLQVIDGLGIDGAGAHAKDEHVLVDRIPLRAALFTRWVLELASASRGA